MISHNQWNSQLSKLNSQHTKRTLNHRSASHVPLLRTRSNVCHFFACRQLTKTIQTKQKGMPFTFWSLLNSLENSHCLCPKLFHCRHREHGYSIVINFPLLKHIMSNGRFTFKENNSTLFIVLQKLTNHSHKKERLSCCRFACERSNLIARKSFIN